MANVTHKYLFGKHQAVAIFIPIIGTIFINTIHRNNYFIIMVNVEGVINPIIKVLLCVSRQFLILPDE